MSPRCFTLSCCDGSGPGEGLCPSRAGGWVDGDTVRGDHASKSLGLGAETRSIWLLRVHLVPFPWEPGTPSGISLVGVGFLLTAAHGVFLHV